MVTKITLQDKPALVEKYFPKPKTGVYMEIVPNTEVDFVNDEDVNMDYIKEHNIEYFQYPRAGGAIVFSKGDVSLGMVHKLEGEHSYISDKFLHDFGNYLKTVNPEIKVEVKNNDLMVNDYKVVASSELNLVGTGYIYTAFHISVGCDLEAIKNICKKPMVKIPGSLSNYGITTDDVESFCIEYFKDI